MEIYERVQPTTANCILSSKVHRTFPKKDYPLRQKTCFNSFIFLITWLDCFSKVYFPSVWGVWRQSSEGTSLSMDTIILGWQWFDQVFLGLFALSLCLPLPVSQPAVKAPWVSSWCSVVFDSTLGNNRSSLIQLNLGRDSFWGQFWGFQLQENSPLSLFLVLSDELASLWLSLLLLFKRSLYFLEWLPPNWLLVLIVSLGLDSPTISSK